MSDVRPILVVKYGGNSMIDDDLKEQVLKNLCSLKKAGYDVSIVHGGGPFIKEALEEARIESEFIDGHRKTTPRALQYVEMALKGKVNGGLVRIINGLGYKAVGLSGKDGRMVTATKRMHKRSVDGKSEDVDLGQVGDVAEVDPTLLTLLLERDYVPVITCLASDSTGEDYNINADMFAGHIAGALGAAQYIVLTDVDGLLRDKDDAKSLIEEVQLSDMATLLEDGTIAGGMIPKVESCVIAINKGSRAARIINGTKPEQLLMVIEKKPIGTVIAR